MSQSRQAPVDIDLARAHLLSDMGRTAQSHMDRAAQHRAAKNEGLAAQEEAVAEAIEAQRAKLQREWWGA